MNTCKLARASPVRELQRQVGTRTRIFALALLVLVLSPGAFRLSASPAAGTPAQIVSTATGSLSKREAPLHQLTYVNDQGYLMLADADGAWQRRLLQAYECIDSMHWAASGDRLVCHVFDAQVGPHPDNRIVVIHVARGRVREVRWVDRFAWSPTGRHMAFRISRRNAWEPGNLYLADADGGGQRYIDHVLGPFAWKQDGSTLAYTTVSGSVIVYNVATGTRRKLASGRGAGLRWVRAGSGLLLDRTVLVDLSLARRYRIPALGRQTWFSSDGNQALSARSGRLELVDLRTLRATRIGGATYAGLGDGEISVFEAAFSSDGTHVFWTDLLNRPVGDDRTAIYRAVTDGSGLVQVATVRSAWVWFSPDLRRIALVSSPADGRWVLETAKLDGTHSRTIGRIGSEMVPVWRPVPNR